jgi:hypothetical protein
MSMSVVAGHEFKLTTLGDQPDGGNSPSQTLNLSTHLIRLNRCARTDAMEECEAMNIVIEFYRIREAAAA